MQISNVPGKVQLPFASSAGAGYIRTVPVPYQIGITPGAASFTDGFPPLNFLAPTAGGVAPSGEDFNGLLNVITAIQQWQSDGGLFPYDSAFSTAVGGYPKGAVLLASAGTGIWFSQVDNNTSNPDTGGANWDYIQIGSNANTRSGHTYTVPDWFWIDRARGFFAQYVQTTIATGNGDVVTLPTSFTSAILHVTGMDFGGGAHSLGWAKNGTSLSTIKAYGRDPTASGAYANTAWGALVFGV
jgi:hypothetical protein